MRKAILVVLLAVVSSSVMAEWVGIDVNHDGSYGVFADPATIIRAGSKVKMWTLNDYKTVSELNDFSPPISLKLLREFDCKKKQTRILYTTHHSENMGRGEVVDTNIKPHDWEPVGPVSVAGALLEFACKKR